MSAKRAAAIAIILIRRSAEAVSLIYEIALVKDRCGVSNPRRRPNDASSKVRCESLMEFPPWG
jgi:hypothetical protein